MHTYPLRRNVLALIVIGSIGLGAAAAAEAKRGPATRSVERANETVRGLLRKKAVAGSVAEKQLAKQLTTQVRSFLDIDELGRRALSRHWDKLAPTQRSEYLTLLRSLIEKNYIKGLRSNLSYKVEYIGETAKGKHKVVTTQIKTRRRGRPYTVAIDYLVHQDQGAWRAYDIITDGVGLVENYRAQFNRIIARKGFDDLLTRMRKKLAKLGS